MQASGVPGHGMQRVRAALPTRIRGVSVLRLGLIALIAAASWPVVDDLDGCTAPRQFAGDGAADNSGADDNDVARGCHVFRHLTSPGTTF